MLENYFPFLLLRSMLQLFATTFAALLAFVTVLETLRRAGRDAEEEFPITSLLAPELSRWCYRAFCYIVPICGVGLLMTMFAIWLGREATQKMDEWCTVFKGLSFWLLAGTWVVVLTSMVGVLRYGFLLIQAVGDEVSPESGVGAPATSTPTDAKSNVEGEKIAPQK